MNQKKEKKWNNLSLSIDQSNINDIFELFVVYEQKNRDGILNNEEQELFWIVSLKLFFLYESLYDFESNHQLSARISKAMNNNPLRVEKEVALDEYQKPTKRLKIIRERLYL